jgi:hypothetical protein
MTNPYVFAWSQIFSLIGDGMRVDKGLLSVTKDARGLLDQLVTIAKDEDYEALTAMEDQLVNITEFDDQFQAIFNYIPEIAVFIGFAISHNMRPNVNGPVDSAVPPSHSWELRNYLSWKKPGDFAKKLLEKGKESGDPGFLAYAYGYLVSYVANVTGSPFINSIIGAPYRNHWWRYRWVNNYIDAWVYGKYESGATMQGDTPNPPYDQWPNLCEADLHKKIALDEHNPTDLMQRLYNGESLSDRTTLPTSFGRIWVDAFNETYNPPSSVGGLIPESLNDAYLLTWLVLWFQTSRDGLGCNPTPPLEPPDGCGGEPDWVSLEPSDESGQISVTSPPEPEIESDPDVGKIISGVLLAIIGVVFWLFGNFKVTADGIRLVIEGATEPDWEKLRCDLHWYNLYLFHALDALQEILSVTAFRYPYASEMAIDTKMSDYFSEFVDSYDSGKALTKSQPDQKFPAKPWNGGFNWMNRPTDLEDPATTAYKSVAYPSFFVDDAAANPLSNGSIRVAGTWPVATDDAGIPVQFGNAVDNAIDLFMHLQEALPNWNLDADRGLAYHTWKFLGDVYLDPVAIERED